MGVPKTIPELKLVGATYRDVELRWGLYYDERQLIPALQLYTDSEWGLELLAAATVNLPALGPSDGCVILKTWSENEGLAEQLVEAGVVELTGETIAVNQWGSLAVEARVLEPYLEDYREALTRG